MAALAFRGLDVLAPLPLGGNPNASFAGAFLMAPWANRLDAGQLPIAGVVHRLPINRAVDNTAIHGLVRDLPWQVAEATDSNATLTLVLDHAPFLVAARLVVTLGEAGLTLALTLHNEAAAPCPLGLGWHPFFLRPAGTTLHFRASTLFARDARTLPIAAQPSSGVDGADYDGLDTAFAGWDGALRIRRPDLALHLAAQGAWASNLQVFAPPGAGILCAEPVSHVPDAPNRPDFAPYGPLTLVPTGSVLSASLTLTAGN